jgi:hypothetical protein
MGIAVESEIIQWISLLNFIIFYCVLNILDSGNQIEKNEMGGACSTYGGTDRCIPDFGGETWGKATTWETQAQMGW